MFKPNILKNLLVGGIGIGAFFTGIAYEKCKIKSNPYLNNNFELSIFTIFAATPFSPVPVQEKNVSRVSQIMKYGFPGLDNIRSFNDFVLSYDKRNRVAHWVFEHLTKESVKYNKEVDRSKCDFKADESIHPYFRHVIIKLFCTIY